MSIPRNTMENKTITHPYDKQEFTIYTDLQNKIDNGMVIIDKSEFIAEIFQRPEKKIHIIRPGGFGKTFNLKILDDFLSPPSENNTYINSLKISSMNAGHYNQYRDKFFVIRFHFEDYYVKDLKRFQEAITFQMLSQKTGGIDPHTPLPLCMEDDADIPFETYLKSLIDEKYKRYNKKIILLMDGIDKLLTTTKQDNQEKYDTVKNVLQQFLSQAFESEEHIEKVIITGRYALPDYQKLGIHLYTVMDEEYSNHFGFSQADIQFILNKLFIPDNAEKIFSYIKEWYNGYEINNRIIFQNKMILSFIYSNKHFSGTCTNDLSFDRYLFKMLDNHLQEYRFTKSFETLLSNCPIQTETLFNIPEEKTQTFESIGNILFNSGYLTILNQKDAKSEQYSLVIPNKKIHTTIENFVLRDKTLLNDWVKLNKQKKALDKLIDSKPIGENYFLILPLCFAICCSIEPAPPLDFFYFLVTIPSLLYIHRRYSLLNIIEEGIPGVSLNEYKEKSPFELRQLIHQTILKYPTYPTKHIQQYKEKQSQIMSFLAGSHPRLGEHSKLNGHAFFKNPLYDKNVVKMVLEFSDSLEIYYGRR